MDVICLNRYYGWYQNSGHPETIGSGLSYELEQWYGVRKKPIVITEYGAGSVAGIHEVSVVDSWIISPRLEWTVYLVHANTIE